jgi:hypothetical protein
MKSNFSKIAVVVLTVAALLGAARLTAYADGASVYGWIGGYEELDANGLGTVGIDPGDQPWYRSVASGDLTDPPFFGQNTVMEYIVSGDVSPNAEHVLVLHTEFYPEWEDERKALISSSITGFEVWDGTGYVDCLDGGLGIVPYGYQQFTSTGEAYLRCRVGFVMISEVQGRPIHKVNWDDMYFKIPQPSPSPEEKLSGHSVK